MKKEIRIEEHERSYCSNFVLVGRDFWMNLLYLLVINLVVQGLLIRFGINKDYYYIGLEE
jgi:hypothetical protein